jgi:glycosyltransferase involved in cell wall biosynthesis
MVGEQWAASEYLWSLAAEELMKQGHEVILSVESEMIQSRYIHHLQAKGAQVFPRKCFISAGIDRRKRRFFSAYTSFFRAKPDVICVSQGSLFDITWMPDLPRALKDYGGPFVLLTHFNADSIVPSLNERQLATDLFSHAYHHFFVSRHNLLLAERQLGRRFDASSVVTGNRLSAGRRTPLRTPAGTVEMACVARLATQWKGQDILLETLGSDEWKKEDWRLTFYGSGTDKDYIWSLALLYGIDDKVCFGGYEADLDKLWAGKHLHVLAARGEGGPLVTIEAMLRGRFCVTTDVGRNREFINDGIDGFIAEAPTAHSFSKALRRAWAAKRNWAEMGTAAWVHACSFLRDDPVLTLVDKLISWNESS